MSTEKNAAAQALRAIPSKKREQASRENGKKGGRKPTAVCTCGQDPHRYNCPVYFREKKRAQRNTENSSS